MTSVSVSDCRGVVTLHLEVLVLLLPLRALLPYREKGGDVLKLLAIRMLLGCIPELVLGGLRFETANLASFMELGLVDVANAFWIAHAL